MTPIALLVDGTNLVMRASFGGDVDVAPAVDTAARWIGRACGMLHATHLIVAFDSPEDTWRRSIFPAYKAGRSVDTSPYSAGAAVRFSAMGWCCVSLAGYEADDLIATLAARTTRRTYIYSGDRDLLAAISDTVTVVRPEKQGALEHWDGARVLQEYGVTVAQLPDYKALVGDTSDGYPGVARIGPQKAARLLQAHGSIDRLLACQIPDTSREAAIVRNTPPEELVRWRTLAQLVTTAPLDPIPGFACAIKRAAA